MNQILYIGENKGNGPIAIKSIVKFFAIVIIVFGIILIGKGSYAIYKNIEKEKVNEALKDLTSTQFRRIDLHIVNEITIRDVAKLEKVQKSQIQKSLELGLKKIKKFFEE